MRSTLNLMLLLLLTVELLQTAVGSIRTAHGEELPMASKESRKRYNLVLVSLDTLRADHLGVYGYARNTSPTLDHFAKRAVIFNRAVTAAPWTLPSHVSIMSGLFPSSHGVVKQKKQKISPETQLLAEVLTEAGYRSFGFVGGGYVSKAYGFSSGFEKYVNTRESAKGKNEFPIAVHQALKTIDSLSVDDPFFVFLHTYDIHCPYDPPPEVHAQFLPEDAAYIDPGRCGSRVYNREDLSKQEVEFLSAGYDGNIKVTDDSLHTLVSGLIERGRLSDTVIAITSDHGEEFHEHGNIGHKNSLHKELLLVPLIIYFPGASPKRISEEVGLVDLMPTLLSLVGVQPPAGLDGKDLMPLLFGGTNFSPRAFQFTELERGKNLRSSWKNGKHLIWNIDSSGMQLYDTNSDPNEKRNLLSESPSAADAMAAELKKFVGSFDSSAHPSQMDELPAEELDQLKSLGYL